MNNSQEARTCKHCGATAEQLGPIGMWQHCPEHEGGSLTHEWPDSSSEEARIVKAPWTAEQVANLLTWQVGGYWHPFTCGGEKCRADLLPTVRGWICPLCDYTQDWAHEFMAQPIPQAHREMGEEMTQEDPVSRNRRIEAEQVEAGRLVGAAKANPLHSQASEEALAEARKLSDQKCPHLKIGAIHGRGLATIMANRCDECVALLLDHVSRERTRQALERAAKMFEDDDTQRYGYTADHAAIAAAIRGLSDGECVASKEKEE